MSDTKLWTPQIGGGFTPPSNYKEPKKPKVSDEVELWGKFVRHCREEGITTTLLYELLNKWIEENKSSEVEEPEEEE